MERHWSECGVLDDTVGVFLLSDRRSLRNLHRVTGFHPKVELKEKGQWTRIEQYWYFAELVPWDGIVWVVMLYAKGTVSRRNRERAQCF
jgi:hypothetical protein